MEGIDGSNVIYKSFISHSIFSCGEKLVTFNI